MSPEELHPKLHETNLGIKLRIEYGIKQIDYHMLEKSLVQIPLN